jgi:DNA (cytosine-5)-methyltransferase 1
VLKPREHGRVQRFSDNYRVIGNASEQTMGFGNAVSSNVAQWLGGIVAGLLGAAA